MPIANTQSQADRAYERFQTLVESHAIFRVGDRTLTEADTGAVESLQDAGCEPGVAFSGLMVCRSLQGL